MNTSLIIRALMHSGYSYQEAVSQSRISLEPDSKIAVVRLLANCTGHTSEHRQSFGRRLLAGGINRF